MGFQGLYAEHIIARCDTVSFGTAEEDAAIRMRAHAGEFDADLDWRSPYLVPYAVGVAS